MKFSSLAALEVVILTTFSAASDENFIKMKTFPFQCPELHKFNFAILAHTYLNSRNGIIWSFPRLIAKHHKHNIIRGVTIIAKLYFIQIITVYCVICLLVFLTIDLFPDMYCREKTGRWVSLAAIGIGLTNINFIQLVSTREIFYIAKHWSECLLKLIDAKKCQDYVYGKGEGSSTWQK